MFEAMVEHPLAAFLLGFLTLALATDMLERRIPNGLVVVGSFVAVVGHTTLSFPAGLATALGGAVVGLACLLPFYLTGRLGAGDVKLMAMCGAFLGPVPVAAAAVASLVTGGAIGVLWFFWQYFSNDRQSLPADVGRYFSSPMTDCRRRSISPVPYALAIYAGVVTTLILSKIPGAAW